MQAIQTKYLAPTNYRGSRIKAWCEAGSVVSPIEYDLPIEWEHRRAATMLAEKLGWTGKHHGTLHGGCLPSNNGYAFVFVRECDDE